MKKLLTILSLATLTTGALAQGTIKFANTSSILISCECTPGVYTATPGNATMQFYYAVLSAPQGVLDPSQFVFAGVYATNTATAGRIQGGSLLGVPMNSTWPPGQTRQFLVVGWSANYGPTFDPAWMQSPIGGRYPQGPSGGFGYFWFSMIALGEAGGPDPVTGLTIPALVAFAGTTISSGFVLYGIPEPNTAALAGLGAAVLLISRHRKLTTNPNNN